MEAYTPIQAIDLCMFVLCSFCHSTYATVGDRLFKGEASRLIGRQRDDTYVGVLYEPASYILGSGVFSLSYGLNNQIHRWIS